MWADVCVQYDPVPRIDDLKQIPNSMVTVLEPHDTKIVLESRSSFIVVSTVMTTPHVSLIKH